MLKYIYFGTPEISKDVLDNLIKIYSKPIAIVTSIDTPSGRGMKITTSPVGMYADLEKINLLKPNKLIDIKEELTILNADIGVLFAYGKIIPQWLLDLFPYGIINVHPSLLPQYRGSNPLVYPLLNNDKTTGITIMEMDKDLDHGDIFIQQTFEIKEQTNRLDLEQYVVENSPILLKQVMDNLEQGTQSKINQDHNSATFTEKTKKEDGLIKLDDPDQTKYNKYKAYINWPGIYFFDKDNKRIKITTAHMEDGKFIIDKVIPENSKEINYTDYLKK